MGRPKSDKSIEMKNLNARVPKDLAKKLKMYCVQHEITVQNFLIDAIQDKLKKK